MRSPALRNLTAYNGDHRMFNKFRSKLRGVLITHDEDFVVMLKNELSTQSNVSMPEKYFQIRREEGMDGKYYSKIDAVDWEELL